MSEQISSRKDILSHVQVPGTLSLDCSVLKKGIDNYHVDIHLSDYFVTTGQGVLEGIVKKAVAGSRSLISSSDDINNFREAYKDMMTTTLHRVKTNLKPEYIQILQFGVTKFVLKEIRGQLEGVVQQMEETLAQQQYAGSRNLLPTQEKFAQLRRNYDAFLYRSNRAAFQLLQREENSLRELRKQLVGGNVSELMNVMFSPMLAAGSPQDITMLVECYGLWPKGGGGFSDTNLLLEKRLGDLLPELEIGPLKADVKLDSSQSEVYDTLHGLFSSQNILGPSENQVELVSEKFCWLEHPGNVRLLFDETVHKKFLRSVKESDGLKAHWRFKSDVKKLLKAVADLRKKVFSDIEFREALAAYLLRGNWSTQDQEIIELPQACAYVAGNDSKKILSKVDQSKVGASALIKRLDELEGEVSRQIKEESEEKFLQLLTDLCRYRLHLKYYRFAHRLLNRIRVITEHQEIQLAKAGGCLYELLGFDDNQESENSEPEIFHHAIIKADVRGSTKVIEALVKKDLNPASYFSLRFFNPINELLAMYGASKVFIEGDAIILAIYEKNNEPEQWYAVARACGIARDILDIVHSKNAHSKQTGLPALEIGIGISYLDEKPLFLFDEDRPIMISSAIGDADRLSSCSWKLRESFKGNMFGVEVLEVADGEMQKGEKGQNHIRYNVNGVLLNRGGFNKLTSEIPLKKLKLKSGGRSETMFVGKFPDVRNKDRELVIREGKVALWKDEKVVEIESDQVFYEIMPNSKLASQVLELARAKK